MAEPLPRRRRLVRGAASTRSLGAEGARDGNPVVPARTIRGGRHPVTFKVPSAGQEERLDLKFGQIRPEGEHTQVLWEGQLRRHDFLVPVGQYALRVKDDKTGAATRRDVLVGAGQVVYVRP